MKLFTIASLGLAAATQLAPNVARVRREPGVQYSFTGEESGDELMAAIVEMAGDNADEIDAAIQQFTGFERRGDSMEMRTFRGLKMLVLWLQVEKSFGKFCYYGCFCLPEGSHNIASGGYGKPQDNIDAACFDFKRCYRCLVDEHQGDGFVTNQFNMGHIPKDECAGEELGYSRNLGTDGNGEPYIECTNPVGSCRRNICECDKRLAEAFAEFESEWNVDLHEVKGEFKRDVVCKKGGGGLYPFEECCGDRTTFPFNQPKHSNQCCDGAFAKEEGTC